MKSSRPINIKVFTAQGKNGISSQASYIFRKFYKDSAFPESYGAPPVDMWYKKPLFGKLAPNGNAIFLSETNLKQLSTDADKTIFAVDFVADAFTDLQKHFINASFLRKIKTEDSPYISLEPERGWVSTGNIYHSYVGSLYNGFVKKYLNTQGLENKIKNFNDFISVFMLFMRDVGATLPFTRTGFVLSRYCPNNICGLMIDLEESGCSVDLTKEEKYIKDMNFSFFRESAKNFGFLIDKNAPWRLIADLSSPKMKEYMSKYGDWKKTGKMIDAYYYQSHLLDVDTLKIYMIEFYNAYVNKRPYTNSYVKRIDHGAPGSSGIRSSTRVRRRFRGQITKEQVEKFYGSKFWLKTYMTIRMYEGGKEWKREEYNNRVKKVFGLYKAYGFDKALDSINEWTKKEMYVNLGKMVAKEDPNNNLSPSAIQQAQDGFLYEGDVYHKKEEPTITDVISNYYSPKKLAAKTITTKKYFSQNIYQPPKPEDS